MKIGTWTGKQKSKQKQKHKLDKNKTKRWRIHFHSPSILKLQQFLSPNAWTPSRIVALLLSIPPTAKLKENIYCKRELGREGWLQETSLKNHYNNQNYTIGSCQLIKFRLVFWSHFILKLGGLYACKKSIVKLAQFSILIESGSILVTIHYKDEYPKYILVTHWFWSNKITELWFYVHLLYTLELKKSKNNATCIIDQT